MRSAASVEDYIHQPLGRYICGPTYAVWWLNAQLNGIAFWGRPETEHIHAVTCALEAEMAPGVAPHASIVDARHLEAVGLGAFNTMSRYLLRRRGEFARLVTRQAVLRPEGLVGAAVAGFHAVLASDFPVSVFTDTAAALTWLRIAPAAVISEVDAIRTASIEPSLRDLRVLFDAHLNISLLQAAQALGMSTRDLQRKLREAGTGFKLEQNRARLGVAKAMLIETDYDLKRIAIEVGCASGQHLSVLFRELAGVSPSEWRARERSAATSVRCCE